MTVLDAYLHSSVRYRLSKDTLRHVWSLVRRRRRWLVQCGTRVRLAHAWHFLEQNHVCVVAAALPKEKSSSQSPEPEGTGIGPAHATRGQ